MKEYKMFFLSIIILSIIYSILYILFPFKFNDETSYCVRTFYILGPLLIVGYIIFFKK